MSRFITGNPMLLIEHDSGYIDPNDKRNEKFVNEINKVGNGKHIMVEPLELFVILQKYGVKNKNGRIYTEEILRREATNYEELIRTRTALGECVTKETEVYTENGWVNADKVNVGDTIYTLNLETNNIELEEITHLSDTIYNDDLIRVYNKSSLDMVVTKNHKIVLWDRNDNPYEITAENLYEKIKIKDSKISHSYIKRGGKWSNVSPEFFNLTDKVKIPINDWVAFMGIYLSDGHSTGTKGGDKSGLVVLTQVKKETSKKLIELLDRLPFDYTVKDNRQYVIKNKDLYNLLFPLGYSQTKFIPKYLKNYGIEQLEILLEWLLLGDGKNRKDKKGNLLREYYSTSYKLSEDVREIFLKLGNGASITTRLPKNRLIEGRLILAENSNPLYLVHEHKSKGIYLDSRFTKIEKIKHNDHVFGITVDNGTWLMKYNNKVTWTHNSDHPDTAIISNSRVSHEIKKIWWEGSNLVGMIEILMSPGFINQGIISCEGDRIANMLRRGIRVGVSSRGVGSLEEVGDVLVVQDDFELICWDIVTSPSTPGSYMFTNRADAQPFMESVKRDKKLLIDNLDNFLL